MLPPHALARLCLIPQRTLTPFSSPLPEQLLRAHFSASVSVRERLSKRGPEAGRVLLAGLQCWHLCSVPVLTG